jgi:cytochrome c peroxidase
MTFFPAGPGSRSVRTSLLRSLALLALPTLAAAQEPPQAAFTTNPFPARGEERLTVQFLDRSTGDVTSWLWDFGDGTTSRAQNPQHTYLFGNFDVSLTVVGPGGLDIAFLNEAVEVAALPPTSLSTMRIPLPAQLGDYVSDMDRAIELGKALFWDVQVGSDGMTACASCHYHAGVDNRPRNTLHPGADGVFATLHSGNGGGPNYSLSSGDFPFTKYLDPNTGLERVADTDDRRGAAGVALTEYLESDTAHRRDRGGAIDDPLYQVNGADTLQTTGRDAPTTIGAIFFHRLFWDGRANHFFNGRNIWGNADTTGPTMYEALPDGSLAEVAVLLDNGAAASQAIGPPLSGVEMSWVGRDWRRLGTRMIGRRPLAFQQVDPTDGVLGDLANPARPGLTPGLLYEDMIQAAFQPRWWSGTETSPDGFSQMEENFSLFFGLAILCYESTLIPDEAPFDRYRRGDFGAMTASELEGMSLFLGRGLCITCHNTPLFAGAVRDSVINNEPSEGEGLIQRMFMHHGVTRAQLVFATNPGFGELLMDFNPYRRLVAVVDPFGRVLAGTTLPGGRRCGPAETTVFPLEPTPFMPEVAQFSGSFTIEKDGQCGFRMTADVSWNDLGPLSGNYTLLVGGQAYTYYVPVATFQAVYDDGFYNIGVRHEDEDIGVGGNGDFGPLSITKRVQNGEDVGQFPGFGEVFSYERIAVNGAFKTPTLRNVELTGPYMHNGGLATLEQVIEFYAHGADVPDQSDHDRDVNGFSLDEQEKADMVAFLKALTDPRVRHEQAPFDHPALPLKEGHRGDHEAAIVNAFGDAVFEVRTLPATGVAGGPAIPTFAERLPASISVFVGPGDPSGADVSLVCDQAPTAPVTVQLALANPAQGTVTPQSVTFLPEDWRVTRTVRVVPLVPVPAEGLDLVLVTSNASSTDGDFAGLSVKDVSVHFQADPLPMLVGPGSSSGKPAVINPQLPR